MISNNIFLSTIYAKITLLPNKSFLLQTVPHHWRRTASSACQASEVSVPGRNIAFRRAVSAREEYCIP